MPVVFQGFGGRERVEVECYSQLNLLAHAQLDELEIGSRCGGHGHCGGDRVRVTASDGALSKVTDVEREHLTSAELANGWRLACQCFPERDEQKVELSAR